jgi:hypothetical protein
MSRKSNSNLSFKWNGHPVFQMAIFQLNKSKGAKLKPNGPTSHARFGAPNSDKVPLRRIKCSGYVNRCRRGGGAF